MNLLPVVLSAAVIGETGIATEIINTGSSLSQFSASAVLGIVACSCVYAMVKLYKDKQTEGKDTIILLQDTIKKNTETLQSIKDHCLRVNDEHKD